MQEKILKTVLVTAFLSLLSNSALADIQDVDKPLLSPYVLQPGIYMGVGYSYARVQNAGVRDFNLYKVSGATVASNHTSRYSDSNGFNLKFGQLLTKHWGYEINFTKLYSDKDAVYFGPVAGTTFGDQPNFPGFAHIDAKTTTTFGQVLGVYATTLNYNLDLYAKAGLGYETQKQTFNTYGQVYVTAGGETFPVTFDPSSETQTRKSLALATALELRYHIMEHLAVSFEINNLAAKENIVAGNVGLIANF